MARYKASSRRLSRREDNSIVLNPNNEAVSTRMEMTLSKFSNVPIICQSSPSATPGRIALSASEG